MADRTLQQFTDDLKRGSDRELPRKMRRLMGAMAGMAEEYSKDHYSDNGLGVVTGRLHLSLFGKVINYRGGLAAALQAGGGEVVYAAIHEFGGPAMPSRPYLRPAIAFVRREMPADLLKVVKTTVLARKGFV